MASGGGSVGRGGGSTAAVLWLMIALVFLPIVAIHLGARLVDAGQAHAQVATEPAARS